jgi:hypothetical protein
MKPQACEPLGLRHQGHRTRLRCTRIHRFQAGAIFYPNFYPTGSASEPICYISWSRSQTGGAFQSVLPAFQAITPPEGWSPRRERARLQARHPVRGHAAGWGHDGFHPSLRVANCDYAGRSYGWEILSGQLVMRVRFPSPAHGLRSPTSTQLWQHTTHPEDPQSPQWQHTTHPEDPQSPQTPTIPALMPAQRHAGMPRPGREHLAQQKRVRPARVPAVFSFVPPGARGPDCSSSRTMLRTGPYRCGHASVPRALRPSAWAMAYCLRAWPARTRGPGARGFQFG